VAGGDGALGGLDWRIWYLERDDGVASAPLDSWCVLLHIYYHLHFDFDDFGEGFSCALLPFTFLLPTVKAWDTRSVLIPFHPFYYIPVSATYQYLCVIFKDTHFPLA
jgi:hypothetical protein